MDCWKKKTSPNNQTIINHDMPNAYHTENFIQELNRYCKSKSENQNKKGCAQKRFRFLKSAFKNILFLWIISLWLYIEKKGCKINSQDQGIQDSQGTSRTQIYTIKLWKYFIIYLILFCYKVSNSDLIFKKKFKFRLLMMCVKGIICVWWP